MPRARRSCGSTQYGVLVWRSSGGSTPTEVRLPASFPSGGTTVVSDLGTATSLPAYARNGPAIAIAPVPGGAGGRRLLLTAPSTPGTLSWALVANPATA